MVNDSTLSGAGQAHVLTDPPPPRPPKPPPPRIAAIPAELRERPQWVNWRYDWRDDGYTKVPYQPRHPEQKAKADVPSTWGTFGDAWAVYQAGDFDGIGFEFSKDDP